MNINQIMASLEAKHPGELEYLQAVKEVLLSIEDVYNQHPEFEKVSLIERLVEPDRIITFRVPWVDDKGKVPTSLLAERAMLKSCVSARHSCLNCGVTSVLIWTFRQAISV